MLSRPFVVRNHLVDLVLLQHRNHFPGIIGVILHLGHTVRTICRHIDRIPLLIDLHDLRLLLDRGVRGRVKTSLHVRRNGIRV